MNEPYVFKEAIFTKVFIERPGKVPEDLKIEVRIKGNVLESATLQNHLEIRLGVTSVDECPVEIDVEALAFFERLVDEIDLSEMGDFIERQGMPMMFSIIRQHIIVLTSQMGIRPIKLNAPHQYNIQPEMVDSPDV